MINSNQAKHSKGNIMNNVCTEDFADIMSCSRERYKVLQIINAWNHNGLPSNFYEDNVRLAFNKNSGNVFIVNDDCQVAMMNGNNLECFYTSPYDGREGFIDELFDDYMEDKDAWHIEDAEWLLEIKSNLG